MAYANGPWDYYHPARGYGYHPMNPGFDDYEDALAPDPPPTVGRADIGRSVDGRCAAIPNIARGTVCTVKDADTQVIIGVWQITGPGQPAGQAGVTITAYLPMITVVEKVSGRCTNRPGGQTQTFRGAGLRDALNQAADAWCQTV